MSLARSSGDFSGVALRRASREAGRVRALASDTLIVRADGSGRHVDKGRLTEERVGARLFWWR